MRGARIRGTASRLALIAAMLAASTAAAQDGQAEDGQAEDGQAVAASQTTGAAQPRPNINPYDRDIAMTVPLNFNSRVLGAMPVLLTRDDRFIVESAGFQRLINPLLTPEAQAELAARLEGVESFAP